MKIRFFRRYSIGLLAILMIAACSPQATDVPVEAAGTAVAHALSQLLTQTAAAHSPTPSPAPSTPTADASMTPAAVATNTPVHGFPLVLNFAGCWFGPGPSFTLESNISIGKRVEVLGVGSVPGWYIIRNPYFHKPCWFQAANLKFDQGVDISKFPVMTPGP